jgi:serine/threonine protein kinase
VSELLTDREFAGYRVDSVVGRGGMGVVYRATDLALDRTVALKVLADSLAEDPAFRARFVAESKIAASLDHPNIVPIYAAGECDGVLYLAMRFVPGDDLRTVLRAEGRLEPSRVARLIAQIAAALDAAHAGGLVHRDVKPANVLLDRADHVYLGDFGLSKRVMADTAFTRTGDVLGTLDYIAPEQIRRESLSAATDIYALGCTAFHLLTGEVPFPAETEEAKLWAHLSEPPPRLGTLVEGMPSAFDRAVRHALHKRPGDRFASAGELGAAIQAAADGAQARDFERTHSRKIALPPAAAAPSAHMAAARPARRSSVRPAPAGGDRGPLLRAALADPFNLILLGVLLAIGVALGTVALMIPMALAVYAAGVVRSYRDPGAPRHG